MVIVFDHEIILMRSRLTSVAFDWEMFIGFIFKKNERFIDLLR